MLEKDGFLTEIEARCMQDIISKCRFIDENNANLTEIEAEFIKGILTQYVPLRGCAVV